MLRKTYRVQSVRSVRTLPAHLYHRRDFERRKRAMRYIKEEHDYITSARRNNIMFDMAMYKLDQMIAEMKFNHTYDPYTVLTVPRIRAHPLEINILVLILFVAAVLGDSCNYAIGHFFGKKLFSNPNSKIFKQSHLEKTHAFFEKYGGKTIIIARFVPIVRTFAPFVGGMGKMHYYYFMMYNLIGGALWVAIFCYAGYFFGDLPFVQKNLKLLIVAIIFVSLLPAVIEFVRAKMKFRKVDQ